MRIVLWEPAAGVPTLRRCVEDGHEVVAVWTQLRSTFRSWKQMTLSPVKEFALSRSNCPSTSRLKSDETRLCFVHDAEVAVVVALAASCQIFDARVEAAVLFTAAVMGAAREWV